MSRVLEVSEESLKRDLEALKATLNEKDYRRVVGTLANAMGRGGQLRMHEITGMARQIIRTGMDEVVDLAAGNIDAEADAERVRREGGGRKRTAEKNPELAEKVEQIVQDKTYGSPEQVLWWTTLSLRGISDILEHDFGLHAGKDVVARTLKELGYSRQQNQKQLQVGAPHPDRNAQFEFINAQAQDYLAAGDPVISIDCKKKELLGNFKTSGSEYRLKRNPRLSLDHDFELKDLGHIAPYGVYDLSQNLAFMNIGTSRDTAEFAVNSVALWWEHFGAPTYPNAKRLLITCDGGGSNGSRLRLWKKELAELAERTGLEIQVAHFPPGCSKWNKIEHRVFCYISKHCAAQPFLDVEQAISLIGSTRTNTGLVVKCSHDATVYKTGLKVSDDDFEKIDLERLEPMGTWNYIIRGFRP